jgi:uncharacterized protein YuzE
MRLDYDFDADALYVRLRDGEIARTEEIDDETFVDLASDGSLLGIEIISFQRAWPLGRIAERYEISPDDLRQLMLMFPAGGSEARVETPRMTVARELATA